MVNVSRVLLCSRKGLILSLFALVFISVFSFAVFAQEISTDKSDYSPGEIVTITGTGFDANANLQIKITGYISEDIAVPTALDAVTADDAGSFQYYYFLNGFAELYKVEVLDSSNNVLASQTFTDKVDTSTSLDTLPAMSNGQTGVIFSGHVTNSGTGDTVQLHYASNCPTDKTGGTILGTALTTGTTSSKPYSGTFTAPSAGTYQFWAYYVGNSGHNPSSSVCQEIIVSAAPPVQTCGNGIVEGTEQCDGGACCNTDCTFLSAQTVCNAQNGLCDVAEMCTGTGALCPADSFLPSLTECRAANGICDVAEVCTGTDAACPADSVQPVSFECRGSQGVCDVVDYCDGSTKTCPTDAKSTLECRASAGICDLAESCNGVNNDCPTDVFKSSSVICNAQNGVCDVEEKCTGSSATCPTDAVQPNDVECRASAGFCDLAETCDGTNKVCPTDVFKSSSVECRASAGQCDVAEMCTGSGALCPDNAFASAGTSCNDGLFCNVNETCNGAGLCGGGTARVCSYNNIAGIGACDNSPDDISFTWDFRNPFISTCDENADICPSGSETITHTCNKATCGAECDQNSDCTPNLIGDTCNYGGTCNTDPSACSCSYASQYCPTPGTIDGGTCYYGTQSCGESGCGLLTAPMGNYDTCDPVLGPKDTIAPTIDSHSDVTAQATGPTGAVVAYTSPATHDAVDGDEAATCSPVSGSTFVLGDTPVTCNAQDAAGNAATPTTFVVHVVDTTPPVIASHLDVTKEVAGLSGAVVTYTLPTATDAVDGTDTVVCTPVSDSTFAFGTTTVTCSATDSNGNTGHSSFKVIVYGFYGFLPPAKDGSVFNRKQTSTIPLKFQLTGTDGKYITNAKVYAEYWDSVTAKWTKAVSTSNPTTSNLFRYSDNQYIFNLATKNLPLGTLQIRAWISSTSFITGTITLR